MTLHYKTFHTTSDTSIVSDTTQGTSNNPQNWAVPGKAPILLCAQKVCEEFGARVTPPNLLFLPTPPALVSLQVVLVHLAITAGSHQAVRLSQPGGSSVSLLNLLSAWLNLQVSRTMSVKAPQQCSPIPRCQVIPSSSCTWNTRCRCRWLNSLYT